MQVGFTGTREGMTRGQHDKINMLFKATATSEFHHGDCVGSDSQAHNIVRRHANEAKIIVHPPTDDKYRAFCSGDEIREPDSYLFRNHAIVLESELLIATPKEFTEITRSGTWATVRYARAQGVPVLLILPEPT